MVGSFSKTVAPSLRLGYLVAPPAVAQALANVKHLVDWHTPTQTQVALAHFMADGGLQRHIRRCGAAYAQRRERLLRRFADDLAPWFELVPADGRLPHGRARAPAAGHAHAAQPRAPGRRRPLPAGRFFHVEPPRDGLLLGFGTIAAEDIDPALDRVRTVLEQMD